MRSIINDFFRNLGINPSVAMEADDTEVIKRLVESGFGYSILPESALHGAPRFFQTFRVGDRRLLRTQALAMVKTGYPRALTERIAAFLRDALEREANLHSRPANAARQ
jgi:DNA-binding transcriptional LysR family regulator